MSFVPAFSANSSRITPAAPSESEAAGPSLPKSPRKRAADNQKGLTNKKHKKDDCDPYRQCLEAFQKKVTALINKEHSEMVKAFDLKPKRVLEDMGYAADVKFERQGNPHPQWSSYQANKLGIPYGDFLTKRKAEPDFDQEIRAIYNDYLERGANNQLEEGEPPIPPKSGTANPKKNIVASVDFRQKQNLNALRIKTVAKLEKDVQRLIDSANEKCGVEVLVHVTRSVDTDTFPNKSFGTPAALKWLNGTSEPVLLNNGQTILTAMQGALMECTILQKAGKNSGVKKPTATPATNVATKTVSEAVSNKAQLSRCLLDQLNNLIADKRLHKTVFPYSDFRKGKGKLEIDGVEVKLVGWPQDMDIKNPSGFTAADGSSTKCRTLLMAAKAGSLKVEKVAEVDE